MDAKKFLSQVEELDQVKVIVRTVVKDCLSCRLQARDHDH